MKIEDLRNKFREFYSGNNLEESLQLLKDYGASQMESVRVIKNELDISIKEADEMILNSTTWINEKEITIHLRNKLFEALELRQVQEEE